MRRSIRGFFIYLFFVLFVAGVAYGDTIYHLEKGDSSLLKYKDIRRIAVGNPDVLSVTPLGKSELLLNGKAEGGSALLVWDANGRHNERIMVHPSSSTSVWELEQAIKDNKVSVSIHNSTVILEGNVGSPREKRRAESIASAFGDKLVSMLEVKGAPLIRLRAVVMEVKNGALENRGLRLLSFNGSDFYGDITFSPEEGHIIGWQEGANMADSVLAAIDALVEDNEAKILSKPYLMTLSGQEANLNVGGEIPVPVGVENNEIKIEWKPYGVILKITPELDGLGRIWLVLDAEVSEVDWDNAIDTGGVKIPAIRTRRISTRVYLKKNGALVVGGLLDNKQVKLVSKIPLLGDIPIIGELFKSRSYSNSETELVITVMPEVEVVR